MNPTDMNAIVGSHDILFVTLDTLRYDVAAALAAQGRLPNLTAHLPGGAWERRHTPGSFTYAAHHAYFAGFLPTPDAPGPHPRLFAAAFGGSESTATSTFVFPQATLVEGLSAIGYRTVCIGGVGFFNRQTALGSVLPDLFDEAHWSPDLGVTAPASFENQVALVERLVADRDGAQPLLLFLNVSAIHQPNWFYADGRCADDGDDLASHGAALEYVDRHIGRLFDAMSAHRDCFTLVCSDHGTTYGDDHHVGHRVGHPAVWTVPYADFVLRRGE
ncbi:STM4013/SEN3800 family hydrolase [Gordonia hydrophobica]|uniref:STM4013/SEN3800 family hydrolase n=1 Tax=Gordonia hydrophobica TaxID=40516 RepID=A0ABZ2TXQ1_9ACTN|nr:STM4013/SEN3800 family hydrolase [Gordonia hydrophobica]MBM7366467.1 hypothetical protein [Gordonia hydrophobica]